ncbi:hypothetical protein GmHk_05G013022 [Glycine max]|nr:hypothetical protein GmHk_05G013022 [Glycine max]
MEVIYLSFMKKDSRTLGKAWKKNGNGLSFPLDQLVKKRKNEHEWLKTSKIYWHECVLTILSNLSGHKELEMRAELWVNNMSNADNVRTNVDLKGRPFGLGLGAKVSLQSKFVLSNDPVERKLHAKLNAEKRKNS